MDVAEMKPATGKKVKAKPSAIGAHGHAMAVVILNDAEAKGKREFRERETMKGFLSKVQAFGRDDHLQFRKELDSRRESVNDICLAAGLSQSEYRQIDPIANSILSSVSLWVKLSKACEIGLTFGNNQEWATISAEASRLIDSYAVDSQSGTIVEKINPSKRVGRKPISGYDKAIKLLDTLPMQELMQVSKWLAVKIKK